MRIGRFLLVLLLGCFVGAAPVFAQLDLEDFDELYVAPDDSYEFLYPSDWDVDDSDFEDSGFILVTGEVGRDSVYINFVSPELIDNLDSGIGDLEEAGEALAEAFEIEEFQEVEITEREMLLGPIVFEDAVGIVLVVEFEDGGFGATIAFDDTENIFDNEDIVTTVLLVTYTFNSVGANGVGGDDGGDDEEDEDDRRSSLPDELRDFDGTWQDAIAELEDEEVIASGGSLIFNENRAFFDGIGSWFTPLASRSQRRDIVMGATLEFTSDSRDFESCSIMARIENSNTNVVDTYLEVGITNDGEAFWVDSEGNDSNSDVADLDLDLDEQHHILFIAQLDSLNVYVDGELVFEDARISERAGYFGIALLGQGAGSRCEGTNVWAYDAPAFIEGLCEVAASGTVNLRACRYLERWRPC
jgi:hypothetical protein